MQTDGAPVSSQLFGSTNNTSEPGNRYLSSHFDHRLDDLINICKHLILNKGVFHLTIHFSSSQLVCWTFDNPYSFQIYTADEVFSEHFMRLFAPLDTHLHTCISRDQVGPVLETLKSLRQKQDSSELRNASIHMMNGYIALGFACDDTRYINIKNFIRPLKKSFA